MNGPKSFNNVNEWRTLPEESQGGEERRCWQGNEGAAREKSAATAPLSPSQPYREDALCKTFPLLSFQPLQLSQEQKYPPEGSCRKTLGKELNWKDAISLNLSLSTRHTHHTLNPSLTKQLPDCKDKDIILLLLAASHVEMMGLYAFLKKSDPKNKLIFLSIMHHTSLQSALSFSVQNYRTAYMQNTHAKNSWPLN